MWVKKIELTDFRNIRHGVFTPAAELTVICGENGQGKTNLLESVWLQTGAKSFRGSKDMQLVHEDAEFAVLESTIATDEDTAVRIAIGGKEAPKQGRYAKVNGVDMGRATNLAGICTAVVFAPGHLSLVKGSPDGRRRFIDTALCQLHKGYITLLHRYTRQVTQKNALLKNYRLTQDAAAMLDVFDAQLAQDGAKITEMRKAYLADITENAAHNYSEIASGKEEMVLQYEANIEDDFAGALAQSRARDIAAGFCTAGPHRDDFTIAISGREAKSFASQGQQRSAVLSLKLAEADAVRRATGYHPVMLLDDVLSELDAGRQEYLLNRMKDKQTIVTTCDAQLFLKTNGSLVQMVNGEIHPM